MPGDGAPRREPARDLADARRPGLEAVRRLAAEDPGIRGDLLPDAQLAALCLANGARLATRDRGFAHFPSLRWFDPAR